MTTDLTLEAIWPLKPKLQRFARISDDAAEDFAAALLSNLFSDLTSTLATPVMGWIATTLSINGSDAITSKLKLITTQLNQIAADIATMTSALTGLKIQIDFEPLAALNANIPAYSQLLNPAPPANPPTGQDLVNVLDLIFNNAVGYQNMIANALMPSSSNPSGSPLLPLWISTYLPQFYCDAVQLPVIQQLFNYYQQLQLILMSLWVEYYHWPQPGDDSTAPSPPDYQDANSAVQACYNSIQQQFAALPFPTGVYPTGTGYKGSLDGMGCDQIVFDRINGLAWGFQNWGNCPRTSNNNMNPAAINETVSSDAFGSLQVPTFNELPLLSAVTSPAYPANLPYNYVQQVLGNTSMSPPLPSLPNGATTLSDSPQWPDYMNAAGFDIGTIPSHTASPAGITISRPFISWEAATNQWVESDNRFAWIYLMGPNPGGGPDMQVGWQCSYFWDIVNNQYVNLQVVWYADYQFIDLWTDLAWATANPNGIIVWYETWNETDNTQSCTTNSWLPWCDVMLLYRLQTTDPPIEEPAVTTSPITIQQTVNSDGTVSCQAIGWFLRWTPGEPPFALTQIPITEYCVWSVSGDPAASVSNTPALGDQPSQIGVVTFAYQPSNPVTVTASRLNVNKPGQATVQVPPNLPAQSPSKLVNLYPPMNPANPQPVPSSGFQGQVYVQRLFIDGTTIADDTANFSLTADNTCLDFQNQTGNPPNGVYTITGLPAGTTTTITVTAQDLTPAGMTGKMIITAIPS
jgi:hypothetical protein